MPATKRVLRFKHNMPLVLEAKLVNRYGYAVDQRIVGQFISFVYSPRDTVSFQKKGEESNIIRPGAFNAPLTLTRQAELMKRCDNIVDFFPDPYNSEKAIRTRLHNMAQTLPLSERQFIQDYADDNFPIHDKGL